MGSQVGFEKSKIGANETELGYAPGAQTPILEGEDHIFEVKHHIFEGKYNIFEGNIIILQQKIGVKRLLSVYL